MTKFWQWALAAIGVIVGTSIGSGFIAEPFSRDGYYHGSQETISYKKPVTGTEVEQGKYWIGGANTQVCRQNSNITNPKPENMNEGQGFVWVLDGFKFDAESASGNTYFQEVPAGTKIYLPGTNFKYVSHSPKEDEVKAMSVEETFQAYLPDGLETSNSFSQDGYTVTYEAVGSIGREGSTSSAYTDVIYRITFYHLERFQCCVHKEKADYVRQEDGAGIFLFEDALLKNVSSFQCIGTVGNTGGQGTPESLSFKVAIKIPEKSQDWIEVSVTEFFNRQLAVSGV